MKRIGKVILNRVSLTTADTLFLSITKSKLRETSLASEDRRNKPDKRRVYKIG